MKWETLWSFPTNPFVPTKVGRCCWPILMYPPTTGEGIRFAKKNWQHLLRSTSCDSFVFNDVANSLDIRTEWCCDCWFFSLELHFVAQGDGGECLTCSKYVWSSWECHDSIICGVERGGGIFKKKSRRKEERWRGVGGALVREVSSRSLAPDTLMGGHNYS